MGCFTQRILEHQESPKCCVCGVAEGVLRVYEASFDNFFYVCEPCYLNPWYYEEYLKRMRKTYNIGVKKNGK